MSAATSRRSRGTAGAGRTGCAGTASPAHARAPTDTASAAGPPEPRRSGVDAGMTRRIALLAASAALLLPAAATAQAPQPDVPLPAYPGQFELIGHEPLMNRGMNSALAVFGGYAYIGSR